MRRFQLFATGHLTRTFFLFIFYTFFFYFDFFLFFVFNIFIDTLSTNLSTLKRTVSLHREPT